MIVVDMFIKFLAFYGTRNLSCLLCTVYCLLLLYPVSNQCNTVHTSKSSLTLILAFHLSLFSYISQTYFMLHFFGLKLCIFWSSPRMLCNNHNTSSDMYRLCCVHLLLISMSLHADIFQKTLFSSALRSRTFCTVILINILITKAIEMRYFSNLFDKVLYRFWTSPLSIVRSISTLYTHNRYLSC